MAREQTSAQTPWAARHAWQFLHTTNNMLRCARQFVVKHAELRTLCAFSRTCHPIYCRRTIRRAFVRPGRLKSKVWTGKVFFQFMPRKRNFDSCIPLIFCSRVFQGREQHTVPEGTVAFTVHFACAFTISCYFAGGPGKWKRRRDRSLEITSPPRLVPTVIIFKYFLFQRPGWIHISWNSGWNFRCLDRVLWKHWWWVWMS